MSAKELKLEADLIDKLSVSNIGFAPSIWPGRIKIIGTINNNTDKIIKRVNITSSFYHKRRLVNVKDESLTNLRLLKPGDSSDFCFDAHIEDGQTQDNLNVKIRVAGIGTYA